MKKKNLLLVCSLCLITICFLSFPPVATSGGVMKAVGGVAKAALPMVGAALGGEDEGLLKDIVSGNTEGKLYELEVVAPGRLTRHGFKNVKRGDVIYLQILNYDEDIFEICTDLRMECATFQLNDKGRMIHIEIPGVERME